MNTTNDQKIFLHQELLSSIESIKKGLGELQQINFANDFYYSTFQSLSSGFERLMKAIIILHYLKMENKFHLPAEFSKGKKGHDLTMLMTYIKNNCFDSDFHKNAIAGKNDLNFIKNDKNLESILKILSNFGQGDRYYNIDKILNIEAGNLSPENEWAKLEMQFLSNDDLINLKNNVMTLDTAYLKITKNILIILETFTRALCRIFTLGSLSDEAKRFSGLLKPFLFFSDDQLGTETY